MLRISQKIMSKVGSFGIIGLLFFSFSFLTGCTRCGQEAPVESEKMEMDAPMEESSGGSDESMDSNQDSMGQENEMPQEELNQEDPSSGDDLQNYEEPESSEDTGSEDGY